MYLYNLYHNIIIEQYISDVHFCYAPVVHNKQRKFILFAVTDSIYIIYIYILSCNVCYVSIILVLVLHTFSCMLQVLVLV